MAELTRHRLASFSIESTRYNAYNDLTFIRPCFWQERDEIYSCWENGVEETDFGYNYLRCKGATPE